MFNTLAIHLLNFLSVTFLAFGRLYLGILDFKSEECFWVLDFCEFNLRGLLWFACLAYTLPSNISYRVLFSFYRTFEERTKWALNLHSWKTIYLKIIALFLSSFWCTTFLFLSLRSSGGEKNIRFLLFEFVLNVFFAEDFSIRIDEILLKRNFFNMPLLFLRRLRNRSE